MAYLMDLHVYTNNTPGTKDKISFLCETAVEKNIRAVAFTDIIAPETESRFDLKRQVRHAFFDISKAKQLFFGSLTVFAGIELRQAYLDPAAVSKILSMQHYDIVLTSLSCYAKGEPFGLSPEMPQAAFNAFADRYTDLLLRTVETTDFDVLAAPLAPLRAVRADLTYFEECMRKVLTALAVREKALEIDTKDILGSEIVRDLYLRLVACFRQAGGKYITFGSECASHDELGSGIELAMNAVKRAGFSQLTFYDGRIPYTVDL